MKQQPKQIQDLTDREIQERMLVLLEKQERHQSYFSTVLSVYLAMTLISLAILAVKMFVDVQAL